MIRVPVTSGTPVDQRAVSLGLPYSEALTVQQLLGQVRFIREVMKAVMREGEHYGRVPGCGEKFALLKAGAEKLCLTFRLAPAYAIEERTLEGGHREYRVTATLSCIVGGAFIGQGVGSCSSLEARYRRSRPDGTKPGNENPADLFNSVLKMAKKRALVDAVLTSTAASDVFSHGSGDHPVEGSTRKPSSLPSAPAVSSAPAVLTTDPNDDAASPVDFRFTEIHFGKNKGLILAELSPQQLHWYEKEWMPKKEAHTRVAPADLALIRGLKAYREWRDAEKALAARAAAPVASA